MCISKNRQAILRSITLSLPILLATFAGVSYGQMQPDNTKVNQRDRDPNEATADQQKMNASDQQLTTTIRKSIMADKSLSTYAHNVKVISQNGTVTLKGPVRSEDEHKALLDKATKACGSADKVHDEMSVKP
jgi:hyperosmotically inducible protein